MATVVIIISRNQPNKSKLALHTSLNKFLKQLLRRNKTGHFRYRGGCGIHGHAYIEMLKRGTGLGYRLMVSGY